MAEHVGFLGEPEGRRPWAAGSRQPESGPGRALRRPGRRAPHRPDSDSPGRRMLHARSTPAPRPARPGSRRRRCGAGPGLSPGVARSGGVPARTQDAPRCSASAGRAGTGTRRRTVSRLARAHRAPTRSHRREALPAPARHRVRRGLKAEGRSSVQSDARAAGCRRAIRSLGVGDPATMLAGISYSVGFARYTTRTGYRQARCRQPASSRRRIDDWSGVTCTVVGRCRPLVRSARCLDAPGMRYGFTVVRVTSEGRMGSVASGRGRTWGPAGRTLTPGTRMRWNGAASGMLAAAREALEADQRALGRNPSEDNGLNGPLAARAPRSARTARGGLFWSGRETSSAIRRVCEQRCP